MAEIKNRQKAYLALASGRVFQGTLFGASPEDADSTPSTRFTGEVVFNTSLTGYQEILTDPSYRGQIVVMTPSHIGNTGINAEDMESRKFFLSGFVVQEVSAVVSNWRSESSLHDTLQKAGVAGLSGVDTRALTRHLRTQGAVNGLISLNGRDLDQLVQAAKALPSIEGQDLVKQVTAEVAYGWSEGSGEWAEGELQSSGSSASSQTPKKVVVIDYGVKHNILRCLADMNCEVHVVPADTAAPDIVKLDPDGVVLSNGPGDPAVVTYAVQSIRGLIDHNKKTMHDGGKTIPVMGICLGHQLLGLALGGQTYKLKFGHHGSNHPIKDLETGRVDITSQNHGFSVEGEKTAAGEWVVKGNHDAIVTHINLNDNAIEGLRHRTLPMFSVQYHPEASAGPHDARHLFTRFRKLMDKPPTPR